MLKFLPRGSDDMLLLATRLLAGNGEGFIVSCRLETGERGDSAMIESAGRATACKSRVGLQLSLGQATNSHLTFQAGISSQMLF